MLRQLLFLFKFLFTEHLPLPLGEVAERVAERSEASNNYACQGQAYLDSREVGEDGYHLTALSVTAYAVPAPPKGEPRFLPSSARSIGI